MLLTPSGESLLVREDLPGRRCADRSRQGATDVLAPEGHRRLLHECRELLRARDLPRHGLRPPRLRRQVAPCPATRCTCPTFPDVPRSDEGSRVERTLAAIPEGGRDDVRPMNRSPWRARASS